jgi:hypothetical protein
MLEREIAQKNKAKARAEMLYLEGDEDINFYTKYKKKYDTEIFEMASRLRALTAELETINLITNEELYIQAQIFLKQWSNATDNQERNALFNSIINKVWYDRDKNTGEIELGIEYL